MNYSIVLYNNAGCELYRHYFEIEEGPDTDESNVMRSHMRDFLQDVALALGDVIKIEEVLS